PMRLCPLPHTMLMSHACDYRTRSPSLSHAFFFTHPTTTKNYTLSLHDALPISRESGKQSQSELDLQLGEGSHASLAGHQDAESRSEEHTSELQSRVDLVCRLLLEKKNQRIYGTKQRFHLRRKS